MTTHSGIQMRLQIFLRRECYVWLCRRDTPRVSFGWILGYRNGDQIVFKDDEGHAPVVLPVTEIECCGAV